MWICRDHDPIDQYAERGQTVLVPTMGALHEGHLDLIRRGVALARERGLDGGCVVSIFVNPTQFDDPVDFERYARTFDEDADRCRRNGAGGVYAPGVEAVYPPGKPVPVPPLPEQAIGKGLEDAHRPGHFEGVCQVVRRLFDLLAPAAAVFGEKDWQQLRVISEMTRRDGLGVDIIAAPTVREHDGLAMSSRNRFLAPGEHEQALALSRALVSACAAETPANAEASMLRTLAVHGLSAPDYATVRDAETLAHPTPTRPARALIAARVGGVRLLDNARWP